MAKFATVLFVVLFAYGAQSAGLDDALEYFEQLLTEAKTTASTVADEATARITEFINTLQSTQEEVETFVTEANAKFQTLLDEAEEASKACIEAASDEWETLVAENTANATACNDDYQTFLNEQKTKVDAITASFDEVSDAIEAEAQECAKIYTDSQNIVTLAKAASCLVDLVSSELPTVVATGVQAASDVTQILLDVNTQNAEWLSCSYNVGKSHLETSVTSFLEMAEECTAAAAESTA